MNKKCSVSRRDFLKTSTLAAASVAASGIVFPTIVPASVLGKNAPSNKINIAQIGFGRISSTYDLPEIFKNDIARVIAVADLDSKRVALGKQFIEKFYNGKTGSQNYINVKTYGDYREMLLNKDIDAVIISTPDHWHAQPAIEAAMAGKDIYLQKPTSLTIKEGRQLSDVIHRTKCILQIGSQQRSMSPYPQFKKACELVLNGRIGRLHTVYIGLPGDPSGKVEPEMPVPPNLNYDMWLGSTPLAYYTENRVHPQNSLTERPGWLRCEQFGAGMITGWGAHHFDIAHWGMGTEYTGPVEIEGSAEFPKSGLWDVHGDFDIRAKYANGVTIIAGGTNPNGVKFVGDEGWIFASRGAVKITASDPTNPGKELKAIDSDNPKILESVIGENEIHLYESPEQHRNWLDCIVSRKQPIAPVEVGHRSNSVCLLSHIAMKLKRKLYWDPLREKFINDDEANKMLSRPQRFPYGTDYVLKDFLKI
ncbi:MAG: Gfo/Idh/MocA family oxidoreductase [Bacteroidota bacterium]|nr:Gfo/Idh/MocA family oxidoreductase [Bacteroidota bacterium]